VYVCMHECVCMCVWVCMCVCVATTWMCGGHRTTPPSVSVPGIELRCSALVASAFACWAIAQILFCFNMSIKMQFYSWKNYPPWVLGGCSAGRKKIKFRYPASKGTGYQGWAPEFNPGNWHRRRSCSMTSTHSCSSNTHTHTHSYTHTYTLMHTYIHTHAHT